MKAPTTHGLLVRVTIFAFAAAVPLAVACSSFTEPAAPPDGAIDGEVEIDAWPQADGAVTDALPAFDASTDAPLDAAVPCLGRACNERFVLTTEDTLPGAFGGAAGATAAVQRADAFCAAQANGPASLPVVKGRQWKAFVCATGINAMDRVAAIDVKWIRPDGVVLWNDTLALRNSSPQVALGTGYAWTGCTAKGLAGGMSCNDWSSDKLSGAYGRADATTSTAWASENVKVCAERLRIYCFESDD